MTVGFDECCADRSTEDEVCCDREARFVIEDVEFWGQLGEQMKDVVVGGLCDRERRVGGVDGGFPVRVRRAGRSLLARSER